MSARQEMSRGALLPLHIAPSTPTRAGRPLQRQPLDLNITYRSLHPRILRPTSGQKKKNKEGTQKRCDWRLVFSDTSHAPTNCDCHKILDRVSPRILRRAINQATIVKRNFQIECESVVEERKGASPPSPTRFAVTMAVCFFCAKAHSPQAHKVPTAAGIVDD